MPRSIEYLVLLNDFKIQSQFHGFCTKTLGVLEDASKTGVSDSDALLARD